MKSYQIIIEQLDGSQKKVVIQSNHISHVFNYAGIYSKHITEQTKSIKVQDMEVL